MDKIVFTLEFGDTSSNEDANKYLAKGWTLLHVGTKLVTILENGQADYETSYVVGANQSQYDEYKKDQAKLQKEGEEAIKNIRELFS